MYKRHSRNFQNKEYEKTQEQINEIIGALNKNQGETENAKYRDK
jgi:hypothetical protein